MDVVDAAACDLWVPGPEVAQVHHGIFSFVVDRPERAEPQGLDRAAQLLVVVSGYRSARSGPYSRS